MQYISDVSIKTNDLGHVSVTLYGLDTSFWDRRIQILCSDNGDSIWSNIISVPDGLGQITLIFDMEATLSYNTNYEIYIYMYDSTGVQKSLYGGTFWSIFADIETLINGGRYEFYVTFYNLNPNYTDDDREFYVEYRKHSSNDSYTRTSNHYLPGAIDGYSTITSDSYDDISWEKGQIYDAIVTIKYTQDGVWQTKSCEILFVGFDDTWTVVEDTVLTESETSITTNKHRTQNIPSYKVYCYPIKFNISGNVFFNFEVHYGIGDVYFSTTNKFNKQLGEPLVYEKKLDFTYHNGAYKSEFTYWFANNKQYYLWIRGMDDLSTIEVEFRIYHPAYSGWEWEDKRNCNATIDQIELAKDTLDNKGYTKNFHALVWDDIVDKVYGLLVAEGYGWIGNGTQSYLNIKLGNTSGSRILRATMFNAVNYNLNRLLSFKGFSETGIDEQVAGNQVKAEYFLKFVDGINAIIDQARISRVPEY